MSDEQRVAFKEYFGPPLAEDLARRIGAVAPAFPAAAFVAGVAPQLPPLELKGRVKLIAEGLRTHLPPSYPEAIAILIGILGPPLSESEGMFNDSWYLMPVTTFVELYGLDHLAASLDAMHAITQRHTAEFAIRPFIARYPDELLATLRRWATDESFHVRRLVSEGTRTRLPWAANLPRFIADPTPVLELLEILKDDPSAYVRRSVANNLNGIAKEHPGLVLATAARWLEGASPERRALVRHGLRTLVKQGDPAALALLGAEAPQVELIGLELSTDRLRIGEALTLAATLRSTAQRPQQLVVDYIVHMPGASGAARSKVFKLRTQALAPGATLRLARRHSFVPVTVRRLYPGRHRFELQVNGAILGGVELELLPAAE